jgi:hypothetical protein
MMGHCIGTFNRTILYRTGLTQNTKLDSQNTFEFHRVLRVAAGHRIGLSTSSCGESCQPVTPQALVDSLGCAAQRRSSAHAENGTSNAKLDANCSQV